MSKRLLSLNALICLLVALETQAAEVHVNGLFSDQAALSINGKRQVLKAGEVSPEGVRLVSASSESVVVEIDGERRTLTLSTAINSNYSPPKRRQIAISKGGKNAYYVSGAINGRTVKMLVDTGATHIAMNSQHAASIGIDYKKLGKRGGMSTASGVTEAYFLNLHRVSVAGITVHNVKASVSEGDFPTKVLLGMSYLNHVKIEEKAGLLHLTEKH